MAHERLERSVVGIWEVIDSFMRPDVTQPRVLNFGGFNKPMITLQKL